jgi:flagellar biosynthetic protein FliQ
VNQDVVNHIATQALELTLKVSMPFLLGGLIVGLVISIFQAVTQIQEQTLAFIPKILATGAVVAIAGPWMLDQIVTYTRDLYTSIPSFIGP